MTSDRVAAYVSLAALTAAGFFIFPGHTILQSDTQIYIPILEHLWDSSVLTRDPIATQPHVAFTFYDEVALALRGVTGASFELILMVQQFVYRFLALLGCYWLARTAKLDRGPSVLVAGTFGLGATITGPAVLSIEYEPVPRGFALALILLGIGFLSRARWTWAAACASIALWFHPNTAAPVWTMFLLLALVRKQWRSAAVLMGAGVLLAVGAFIQNTPGSQPLFGRISPELEELQRMRAAYNWVSIWGGRWWLHYVILWAAAMAALYRIRQHLSADLRVLFGVLATGGLLSIPGSYVLTEQLKWILMPQFQPGRYLVYTTIIAVLLGAMAAMRASQEKRWVEAAAFLIIPFATPLAINFGQPTLSTVLLIPFALAIIAAPARLPLLVVLAAIFVYPHLGNVKNYAPLHTPELNAVAAWARTETAKDALFQFAGVGRGLEPGVFRARSLRALYADWKSGGQVNFLPNYADVWRKRWEEVEKPQTLERYRELGVDYVVFKKGTEPQGAPVYHNSKWAVFRLTSP